MIGVVHEASVVTKPIAVKLVERPYGHCFGSQALRPPPQEQNDAERRGFSFTCRSLGLNVT